MTVALGVGALALMRRSMQGGNGHEPHYHDGYQPMPYPQAGYEEGWQFGAEPMTWVDPGYDPAIH